MNTFSNFTLYSIVIAVAIVAALVLTRWISKRSGKMNNADRWFCLVIMTFIFSLILILPTERWVVVNGSYIVSQKGDILLDIPRYKSVWKRSLPTGAVIVGKGSRWFSTSSKLDAITTNPKIRHLDYEIRYELIPEQEAVSAYVSWFGSSPDDSKITDYVKSLLYDLNERRSKDLSEFSNPLRDSQQNDFQSLVFDEIGDDLEKVGLTFIRATFTLP